MASRKLLYLRGNLVTKKGPCYVTCQGLQSLSEGKRRLLEKHKIQKGNIQAKKARVIHDKRKLTGGKLCKNGPQKL